MAEAVIIYTDEDTGTVFQWHGGAYIEVGYMVPGDSDTKRRADARRESTFTSIDVINVWDDENDVSVFELATFGHPTSPSVPARPFIHILELFEKRCQDYLDAAVQDD